MKNKKGFTLVELLAVVVILAIIMMISIPTVSRWIDRSKGETKESLKKTLVMATQSYAQGNSEVLPKEIGQTVVVQAQDLKDENFLKKDLVDANKKSCMTSYVKIYKPDKSKYTYTPYVICEGDEEVVPNGGITTPTISIGFSSNGIVGDNIQSVSTSSFRVNITGGTKGSEPLGIDGYSYSVSVRYAPGDQIVEIYSSGSLNGGGKPSITLEKSLADYTDITKVNEFVVKVKVYNSEGKFLEKTGSSLYKDTTPPTCGKIEGQAAVGSWLNQKPSTRTISVECHDNEDGSGCVKDVYKYTFDTEMRNGTITISDNAGNTTNCTVRVNIDWTKPTLTLTAYEKTAGGGKTGNSVGSKTASHNSPSVTLDAYSNRVNGWLNRSHYPEGIIYEVSVSDNLGPYSGTWNYNPSGIYNARASNINSYTKGATTTTNKNGLLTTVSFSANGLRRGRYDFKDEAGNSVSVTVKADLDHTKPSCSTKKSHLNEEDGVHVTISCSDNESKCDTANNVSFKTGVKSDKSYTVNDLAGNTSNSCSVSVEGFDCHPYKEPCGTYVCGGCSWKTISIYHTDTRDSTGLVASVEGNISIGCTQCTWASNCGGKSYECSKNKYTCVRCTQYCTYYKTCYR